MANWVPALVEAALRIVVAASPIVTSISSDDTCSAASLKMRCPARVAFSEVAVRSTRRESNRLVPTLNDM